jgi:hypothetical protein
MYMHLRGVRQGVPAESNPSDAVPCKRIARFSDRSQAHHVEKRPVPSLSRNKMERVTSTGWFVTVLGIAEVWSRFAGNAADLSVPKALARHLDDSFVPHHTRISLGTDEKGRSYEEEASMLRKLFLAAAAALLLPFASAHAGVSISFGFTRPPCRPCLLPFGRPYVSLYVGPSAYVPPPPVYAPPATAPVYLPPSPVPPDVPPPVIYPAPKKNQ